ncbi:unnamed protein product [Orchesella dallaii]|uniref:Gustatory receptor n=1 Tax=Orchesella dallaii TaxID=48710 RepID=A0ABP1QGV1_9HEXA
MRCYNCSRIDSANRFIRVHSGNSNVYNVNGHLIRVEKEECDCNKIGESDSSRMTSERQSYEEISLLAVFFNFLYYFPLIPFKTVLVAETNQYRIQTHMVQKILCLFFHFGVVFFVVSLSLLGVLELKNTLEPSIVRIFDAVNNFTTCASAFLIIFILWRRREKYLEVVENTRVTLRQVKKLKILLYPFITLSSIAMIVVSCLLLQDDAHFYCLRNLDKFLLDKNTSSSNLTSLNFSSSFFEYVFYMGLSAMIVHGSLIYVVIHGTSLMIILTMTKLGKALETELKIGNQTLDVQKGNEFYRRLKSKAKLITNLYGNQILGFYITSICYYAQAPHVFLGKRGNTEKLIMAYFTLTIVGWIVAAEFHKNVQETVLKWIAAHTGNANLGVEDRLALLSLSNEMAADPIALSSRYFSVTYQQFSAVSALQY